MKILRRQRKISIKTLCSRITTFRRSEERRKGEEDRKRDSVAHMRKKCGRLPLEKQIGPRSATKPGRQKIPTIGSAAPGRRPPATVAPLPACPRTAALCLALCPSLRVSSFSFVLQRAHLPAFHSHFLTAHNTGSPFTFVLQHAHLPAFHSHFLSAHSTGSVFLKKILWITFSSVFLTAHNTGTVFLKINL
jgi:hypothetical protein